MKKLLALLLCTLLALSASLSLASCGSSGLTVAVPNDTTNEARALLLLEANGIIKLKEGVGITATVKDIAENPKNISFKEVEAAQMASFGQYNYNPGMRQPVITTPVTLGGGYGGNFNPYGNFYGGIGAPPPYYSQYGNIQPSYNYYRPYGYNNYQSRYQQYPQQPTTYTIPGVNFSGEYLPGMDFEERIMQMEMEYFQYFRADH